MLPAAAPDGEPVPRLYAESVPTTSAAQGLAALGWDGEWRSALADLGDPTLQPGRVSRFDRGACTLMTGLASVRVATARRVEIAVGDWVAVGPDPTSGAGLRIVGVIP